MSGIFISHSSKDKPFVNRLAVDLALEGLPVWLDSWELAVGDSLEPRITTGIEGSSFLIVVVSPASIHSKWVQQEPRMGLALESRVQRPFVLPVRIGSADLPEPIGGRIFLDFEPSYRAGLERLVRFIMEQGGEFASVPLSGRLIPLSFSKEVYLKESPFTAAVAPFVETGTAVAERQLLLAHDPVYDRFREALLIRLENIVSEAAHSYGLEKALETTYRTCWISSMA